MVQPNLALIIISNLHRLKETTTVDDDGIQEGYLFGLLKTYNTHLIFAPIFQQHSDDKRIAVIKSAFIILAYTNKCTWLNFNKDRYINKKEILASLVHDSGIPIEEGMDEILLRNSDATIRDVINHYLEYQKDDLLVSIIAYSENIALGRKMAMDNTKDKTTRDINSITENLNKLKDNQNYLNELIRHFKNKFSDMDEISKREGRPAFTEDLDLTNYETRLKYIMNNPEVLDDME